MKTIRVYRTFPWVAPAEDSRDLVLIDDVGDKYWSVANEYKDPYDNRDVWNHININPDQIISALDDTHVVGGREYPFCELKMSNGDVFYLADFWKKARKRR